MYLQEPPRGDGASSSVNFLARLGGQIFPSGRHMVFFFFLAPFCLLLFCFCTSSRKEHDQPRLMAM